MAPPVAREGAEAGAAAGSDLAASTRAVVGKQNEGEAGPENENHSERGEAPLIDLDRGAATSREGRRTRRHAPRMTRARPPDVGSSRKVARLGECYLSLD